MRQPYTREYIADLQHQIDLIEQESGPSAEIDKQRKNLAAMDKMIVWLLAASSSLSRGFSEADSPNNRLMIWVCGC